MEEIHKIMDKLRNGYSIIIDSRDFTEEEFINLINLLDKVTKSDKNLTGRYIKCDIVKNKATITLSE